MAHRSYSALLFSFSGALLASCSSEAEVPPPVGGTRPQITVVSMAIEAEDVRAGSDSLRALVDREEGYVRSAVVTRELGSFELRVPSERLTVFRAAARRLGEVTDETENVEDVGDRRVDLDAGLREAHREEAELVASIAARAESVDRAALDVRLEQVRRTIAELDRRHSELTRRVQYANVSLTLAPRRVPFWREPGASISSSAAFGFDVFSAIAVSLAAVLAALAPFLLTMAALASGLHLALRRRARAVRTA